MSNKRAFNRTVINHSTRAEQDQKLLDLIDLGPLGFETRKDLLIKQTESMRSDLVLKKIFNDKLHFMTRRHRLKQIMPKDYLRRLEDKQPNNFFNKNY